MIWSGSNNLIDNCTIINSAVGIGGADSTNLTVRSSKITAAYEDVYVGSSGNVVLEDLDLQSNTYILWMLGASPSVSFTNGKVNVTNGGPEFVLGSGVSGAIYNFTNVTRRDNASVRFTWPTSASATVNYGWYLDVNVSDSTGALDSANVSAWDVNGSLQFSTLSNSSGRVGRSCSNT